MLHFKQEVQHCSVARNSYTEIGARVGVCDHITL